MFTCKTIILFFIMLSIILLCITTKNETEYMNVDDEFTYSDMNDETEKPTELPTRPPMLSNNDTLYDSSSTLVCKPSPVANSKLENNSEVLSNYLNDAALDYYSFKKVENNKNEENNQKNENDKKNENA